MRVWAVCMRGWMGRGALEALLELAGRDEGAGLGDAPWPPHFKKTAGEKARVAPSRVKTARGELSNTRRS